MFGERATQLQSDELKKGELINVIGYEHERTWTDKNDQQRTEVQIYAAVITRTGSHARNRTRPSPTELPGHLESLPRCLYRASAHSDHSH